MSKCAPVVEKLNALLDHELSVGDWVRVRWHLIACTSCRQRLVEYRRLTNAATYIRSAHVRPRWIRLVPVLAFGLVVAVICATKFLPKKEEPLAIVIDEASLAGDLKPTSAFYAEGNSLVLRDPKSGMVLASAPGHTRQDAFQAISIANKAQRTTKPRAYRIELDQTNPGLSIKVPDGLVALQSADVVKEDEQIVIFFSGEPDDLKGLKLPLKGSVYFVKIIDPKFFSDMNLALPTETFFLSPNKKPSTVNR